MNPYEWLFDNPELAFWYAAIVLILLVWVGMSVRALFRWFVSIMEGRKRWKGNLPDWKASKELSLFTLTVALNLFLLGAFVHVVT